jgi:plastocyanin
MTARRSIAPLLAAALAILLLLSCFSDRTSIVAPDGDGCEVPASAIGPGQAVVFIRNFAFFPDTIRIRAGTRVTWVNCESSEVEPHTSTANASTANADTWNSGPIAPGESFAQTFTAAGTSGYFCIPHRFMIGAVVVE